jgi:hypothetical protein
VKPSNVLIAEDGRVVLTDFGIAQVEGDPSITSTGMLVGAPSYISPERARGHKPGRAADLWSLGGLLYAAVEGVPPYDKGSAIATLTAVMTEPLEEPKNAGPLKDVIYGLLAKDTAQRLDDAGARAMLNAVIHAPEKKEAEPEPVLDATKVVPLPAQPDAPAHKGGSAGGGKRGEEAGERLRGALRSVRKAAAGAASAGSAGAARTKSGGTAGKSGSGTAGKSGSGTAGSGSAGVASGVASGVDETRVLGAPASSGGPGSSPSAASATGSVSGGTTAGSREQGAQGTNAGAGGRSSGWPVMPPPDLPPRPMPRASLTDVVPRRTLVIIAVAVVLAVIGTVLAFALGNDDSGSDGAKGGRKAVASAAASAETKEDVGGATGTDGSATKSAAPESTPSASASSGAGAGSDGAAAESTYKRYKGNQGYSIGLPQGWKYQSTSAAGDRFTGPDGQKLLVGWTSTPQNDPVADWKNQERYMQRSQYQKIHIEAVDFRDWNTADWEFTYTENGTKYRTIDRGFVVNDHLGYALMYTAKAADWDSELRRETWQMLTKTFEPKP